VRCWLCRDWSGTQPLSYELASAQLRFGEAIFAMPLAALMDGGFRENPTALLNKVRFVSVISFVRKGLDYPLWQPETVSHLLQ